VTKFGKPVTRIVPIEDHVIESLQGSPRRSK
jgi:antitoxin (DNA-binding transcriptional repressor) of toxin-antitoxin stability system